MSNLNGLDVALLVAAGYLAVTSLVRLMIARRNQAVDEFRKQLAKQRQLREIEQTGQRSQGKRAA